MKATLRMNESMMFTFRVKFNISKEDLERCVTDLVYDDGTVHDLLPKTRGEILKKMREQLKWYGNWDDSDWDHVTDVQRKVTREIVQDLFPELY